MEQDYLKIFSGGIEYFQYSCDYSLQKTKSDQINLSALNYLLILIKALDKFR